MNRFLLWAILVFNAEYMLLQRSTGAEEPIARPIVIAHRGASGYLPEHTEGAKVLAMAQGADYIEQDVVLSKDRVLIVTHDTTMESTTNVEELFPGRQRADGKFYFADFSWDELRTLSVHERTGRDGKQVYAGRFPGSFHQRLMRLEDELQLVAGWNANHAAQVGIYVEIKAAAWHEKEFGTPVSEILLPLLARYGYTQTTDRCFIQCFEPDALKTLHRSGCQLRLIQLTGGDHTKYSKDWDSYTKEVASYAQGIGPSMDWLVDTQNSSTDVPNPSQLKSSGLVQAAHRAGLLVHPYTIRVDQLPRWTQSVEELHRWLITEHKVDGFFSDFPDTTRAAVDKFLPASKIDQ